MALIEDTLRTGKVRIPFVLDLIVIKDVGLLPTWLSCPYQPEHIKQLKVNVRVFRPDKAIIPKNWTPTARNDVGDYSYDVSACQWHFLVVFLFYAMGRLTPSSENTIREQSVTALSRKLEKLDFESQSPGVDVYVSEKAPYTVDELSIKVQPYEHYANGKVVLPYVDDRRESRFWREEDSYNFCRSIFIDYGLEDNDKLKGGMLCTRQLLDEIGIALEHLSSQALSHCPWYPSAVVTLQIYLDAVVRNIKTVKTDHKEHGETIMGDIGHWEGLVGWSFESDDIIKAFKKEKRKKEPNEHILHWFKLVKRRMDLGWWDDDQYKRYWHYSHPNG